MIISDSNILSSFAAARSLPLLFAVVGEDTIYISPAVYRELQEGLVRGLSYLSGILELIESKRIRLLAVTDQDWEQMALLPVSFGDGEREAVAMCIRVKATLLSNEKRVVNYCDRSGVVCLNLKTLLKMLWSDDIASKSKVKTMMKRMAKIEGFVFKNPQEVFAD